MKDSSGDQEKMREVVKAVKPGFQVLSGSGTGFGEALQIGAAGAILAIANPLPYACVTIWEAFRARQIEAANDWQARILPASKLIAAKHGIPGLKHAMDLNGYYGGPPRLPFIPPSAEAKGEIEQAFEELRS
jgi:4-hydroxy-2-oxoglutarate aldolase